MKLGEVGKRRWRNFKANRRAYWSLWIFLAIFAVTLPAEWVANDRPLLIRYDGGFYFPVLRFYPESAFGGDFATEAAYGDREVRALIQAKG
jgi:microcin C transport system permease protein